MMEIANTMKGEKHKDKGAETPNDTEGVFEKDAKTTEVFN